MFITTLDPTTNTNALAGEALTNGDTVIMKLVNGLLQAFKTGVVAGARVDGFATIAPTSPIVFAFPQFLSTFQATKAVPTGQGAFGQAETLSLGWRILIQQGTGRAYTNRIQPSNYNFGDPLAAFGDGTLKKAGAGDYMLGVAQESKITATGDRLLIQFNANIAHKV